jgi:hypothetical protein
MSSHFRYHDGTSSAAWPLVHTGIPVLDAAQPQSEAEQVAWLLLVLTLAWVGEEA